MSKQFPADIDYREATPCSKCGSELECFNVSVKPTWMACPACESPPYEKTRAIMRIDNIRLNPPNVGLMEAVGVIADLKAGPETILFDAPVQAIVVHVLSQGYTCDGINYSLYQKMRDQQRAKLEQQAAAVRKEREHGS